MPATYRLEIAFASTPDDPTPTWVDVTPHLLHTPTVRVQRGRADEFDMVGPSIMTFELNNFDGRYTPDNPAGIHYPGVKKGRKVRFTALPSSVRFTGYVDSWAPVWPGGTSGASVVTVQASSRMARIAGGSELPSVIEQEIRTSEPGPDYYYTLGEPEGSTSAADSSGYSQPPLNTFGSGAAVVFGTATGPGTDDLTAATFADGKYLQARVAITTIAAVEFFVLRASPPGTAETCLLWWESAPSSANALLVRILSSGLAICTVSNPSGQNVTSTTNVADGSTHHIAVVYDESAEELYMFVDGVLEDTDNFGTSDLTGLDRLDIGNGLNGVIAHVACWSVMISTADILDHANAGLTGFEGELPGARIERYAGYGLIPATEVDADTGSTPLVHIDTTGQTPLSLMQLVAATDDGTLFDSREGLLTFRGRAERYNAAPVAAVAPAVDITPVLDDFGMANDVTATRTGNTGTSVRAVDSASVDEYGTGYTVTLEVAASSDDDLYQAAFHRLRDPELRVPTATVYLHAQSPAVRTAMLTVDIGDKITLRNLPTQFPADEMDFFVEGYAEEIDGTRHTWTANLSPATGYTVWQLGRAGYSELGTTTRLAY